MFSSHCQEQTSIKKTEQPILIKPGLDFSVFFILFYFFYRFRMYFVIFEVFTLFIGQ